MTIKRQFMVSLSFCWRKFIIFPTMYITRVYFNVSSIDRYLVTLKLFYANISIKKFKEILKCKRNRNTMFVFKRTFSAGIFEVRE